MWVAHARFVDLVIGIDGGIARAANCLLAWRDTSEAKSLTVSLTSSPIDLAVCTASRAAGELAARL